MRLPGTTAPVPLTAAVLLLALLGSCSGARAQAPVPPAAAPDWTLTCPKQGKGGFCAITASPAYADNRGGRERVTLTLRRDAECTSMHVAFDRGIDVNRPVLMQVDDGPVQAFYTPKDLSDLADAVDSDAGAKISLAQRPFAQPGFAGFLQEIAAGDVAAGDTAAAELVARFARVKENRRLGIACEATARMLPQLRAGRLLRLSFFVATAQPREPYHWPALDRREIVVPLDRLGESLDSARPIP